jgi:hypothetical protein
VIHPAETHRIVDREQVLVGPRPVRDIRNIRLSGGAADPMDLVVEAVGDGLDGDRQVRESARTPRPGRALYDG